MHIFMIVGALILAAVMIPFASGGLSVARESADAEASVRFDQLEALTRAAWAAARAANIVTGSIDRSAMELPAGFSDNNRIQARAEGGFLYVWDPTLTSAGQNRANLDSVFREADATVDVGVSDSSAIYFRTGTVASKPLWLPNFLLIVRVRV